jgi:excisionase family DNA binding protein
LLAKEGLWQQTPTKLSGAQVLAAFGRHMQRPLPIEAAMSLSISPPQPREERQLVFTSSQAARYVGVSLATVRRWTDAGHIECYRTPGGQRRFSRAQLDEFITSMQRTSPAEAPAAIAHRDAQVA